MSDRPLKLVAQPQAYFHELVTKTLETHRIHTQPETEFYLVNLLNQFMSADQLTEEPLALLLKDALEQQSRPVQELMFRQLGDVSLYTAGYFTDSLAKKLVDIDYYIEMGGTAYQQVASLKDEQPLRSMFSELAQKFSKFVDVLADISDQTTPRTERDLLRLYELWRATGSERIARLLEKAGIRPIAGPGKPHGDDPLN